MKTKQGNTSMSGERYQIETCSGEWCGAIDLAVADADDSSGGRHLIDKGYEDLMREKKEETSRKIR